MLSLAALLFRLSFAIAGPPIGALVDRAGMDAALAMLGVVFTVASLAALLAFARSHDDASTPRHASRA